jgi:DNA-binding CsgD family transcriptional regulator
MLLLPVEPVRGVASAPMRVLGLIRVPQAGSETEQAKALTAMFGLTRSEARLAAAVADGASLAEAADALGLTIETARNYAKRVFAKTRTRGQVDLVRAIAGSVAGLA